MAYRDTRPVKVLSFEAPVSDAERVTWLAKREGVNRSEMLRRLISEGLDGRGVPEPEAEHVAEPAAAVVVDDAGTTNGLGSVVTLMRHVVVREDGEGGIRRHLNPPQLVACFGRCLRAGRGGSHADQDAGRLEPLQSTGTSVRLSGGSDGRTQD